MDLGFDLDLVLLFLKMHGHLSQKSMLCSIMLKILKNVARSNLQSLCCCFLSVFLLTFSMKLTLVFLFFFFFLFQKVFFTFVQSINLIVEH